MPDRPSLSPGGGRPAAGHDRLPVGKEGKPLRTPNEPPTGGRRPCLSATQEPYRHRQRSEGPFPQADNGVNGF